MNSFNDETLSLKNEKESNHTLLKIRFQFS